MAAAFDFCIARWRVLCIRDEKFDVFLPFALSQSAILLLLPNLTVHKLIHIPFTIEQMHDIPWAIMYAWAVDNIVSESVTGDALVLVFEVFLYHLLFELHHLMIVLTGFFDDWEGIMLIQLIHNGKYASLRCDNVFILRDEIYPAYHVLVLVRMVDAHCFLEIVVAGPPVFNAALLDHP